MDRVPKNRWTRAIERRASTMTASTMFAAHIAGAMLLIVSVFVSLAGLLMITGNIGDGWLGRLSGVVLVVGGGGAFWLGRWAFTQFSVQYRP